MNRELLEKASDIVAEYLQNDGKASHIAKAVLEVALKACLGECDKALSDVRTNPAMDGIIIERRIKTLLEGE